MTHLLTIIVPIYKIKEEYLRKCLQSLVDEKCNVSIILVDDGTPDDGGKICDEYANTYENVTVIHQKNSGVSNARNAGLELTQSTWVTFVDGDDWIESANLESICGYLKGEAKDAEIVFCDYVDEFNSKSVLQKMNMAGGFFDKETLKACAIAPFYKLIQSNVENPYSIAVVWNKIYKTEFLKANAIKFSPGMRLGEDRIFNAKALFETDKICYINKTLYHYRWVTDSATNSYNPKITEDCLTELYALRQVLLDYNKIAEMQRYFTCRICTRLYSCMRLYFFNKGNKQPYREKKRAFKAFASNNLFDDALKSVDKSLLTFQEKVFIFSIKHKLYFLSFLLVSVKNRLTKNKLGKK